MPELVIIVPSRGRPHAVAEMVEAFRETCRADTQVLFAIDEDDPAAGQYRQAVLTAYEEDHPDVTTFSDADREPLRRSPSFLLGEQPAPGTMVSALNHGAAMALQREPAVRALGFMGDDHRPRTIGWDRAYLDALTSLPGIVYGNDKIQGANLPTQCAISASVVRALGHMAPPVLTHLYVDNYWLTLGRAAGRISYLPKVTVEHLHPMGGTAEWDDGYRRVNAKAMYAKDRAAYEQYAAQHLADEVAALNTVVTG